MAKSPFTFKASNLSQIDCNDFEIRGPIMVAVSDDGESGFPAANCVAIAKQDGNLLYVNSGDESVKFFADSLTSSHESLPGSNGILASSEKNSSWAFIGGNVAFTLAALESIAVAGTEADDSEESEESESDATEEDEEAPKAKRTRKVKEVEEDEEESDSDADADEEESEESDEEETDEEDALPDASEALAIIARNHPRGRKSSEALAIIEDAEKAGRLMEKGKTETAQKVAARALAAAKAYDRARNPAPAAKTPAKATGKLKAKVRK